MWLRQWLPTWNVGLMEHWVDKAEKINFDLIKFL